MAASSTTSIPSPVGVACAGPGPILGTPGAEKMERAVITQWFADKGDHNLRLNYPLTRDSIVLDVGGYEGNWAAQIDEKYECSIHVFEPVPAFAGNIRQRFHARPNIHVHAYGMADKTETTTIILSDDSTSIHKTKGTPCEIHLRSATDIFAALDLNRLNVDLIKINIEGCEFELLEHMMETGLIRHVRDIQVQFHDFVPNASPRMEAIQQKLARTHHLTWQYRFVWENWHCSK